MLLWQHGALLIDSRELNIRINCGCLDPSSLSSAVLNQLFCSRGLCKASLSGVLLSSKRIPSEAHGSHLLKSTWQETNYSCLCSIPRAPPIIFPGPQRQWLHSSHSTTTVNTSRISLIPGISSISHPTCVLRIAPPMPLMVVPFGGNSHVRFHCLMIHSYAPYFVRYLTFFLNNHPQQTAVIHYDNLQQYRSYECVVCTGGRTMPKGFDCTGGPRGRLLLIDMKCYSSAE